jgi:trypsin
MVHSVKSNLIGSGATSESGFGSSGRLQEVGINLIDYETCNNLYDGDIADSVVLCVGVPGGGEDRCQDYSGGSIFDRERRGRKDWIDATI